VTVSERFWSKVDKSGECWVWTASTGRFGYGQFMTVEDGMRRNNKAHRFAWELTNGPIPAGKLVLHSCDNPACVKPAHLFLGSQDDNMRDMREKGRSVHWKRSGTRHRQFRLTEDEVREIRAASSGGESNRSIAPRFGIHHGYVSQITTRRVWKDVA
jgi:hypothetical protein